MLPHRTSMHVGRRKPNSWMQSHWRLICNNKIYCWWPLTVNTPGICAVKTVLLANRSPMYRNTENKSQLNLPFWILLEISSGGLRTELFVDYLFSKRTPRRCSFTFVIQAYRKSLNINQVVSGALELEVQYNTPKFAPSLDGATKLKHSSGFVLP